MARVFRRTRHHDVEALIRVMVLNRLCDPESKLGVLRWVQTVALPEVGPKAVTHQQLLRSLDALMDHQDEVEVDAVVAGLLRPLIDQDLSVVFYDLTTIRSEGLSQQAGDVRQYGMAKEGLIARQFMLGVVQTAEGCRSTTRCSTAMRPRRAPCCRRSPRCSRASRRCSAWCWSPTGGCSAWIISKRLKAVRLASGKPLEFILAVPGRRYNEFVDLLEPFHEQQCARGHAGSDLGDAWNGLRLVVAHDPVTAAAQDRAAQRAHRHADPQADAMGRQARRAGRRREAHRGRKLSDSGAKARFYHAVSEAHCRASSRWI
jgi:hypothetical protein